MNQLITRFDGLQVWAFVENQNGVNCCQAEVVRLSNRRMIVRLNGTKALLSCESVAGGGGAQSSRHPGVIFSVYRELAEALVQIHQTRWDMMKPKALPHQRHDAAKLLGLLGSNYSCHDVQAAFRRCVIGVHPDHGGSIEQFDAVVKARATLMPGSYSTDLS
jgi:hypothetical protein